MCVWCVVSSSTRSSSFINDTLVCSDDVRQEVCPLRLCQSPAVNLLGVQEQCWGDYRVTGAVRGGSPAHLRPAVPLQRATRVIHGQGLRISRRVRGAEDWQRRKHAGRGNNKEEEIQPTVARLVHRSRARGCISLCNMVDNT